MQDTVSFIFMTPTLGLKKEILDENGCINAYSYDKERDYSYDHMLFLLFKPKSMKIFNYFLDNEYDRTEALVEDYDLDGGYVVLVYKLNEQYNEDWNLVKQGKYSKTSKEFQNLFPKVKKVIVNGRYKDELSLQLRIFNKDPQLKEYWEELLNVPFKDDMEFWDKFDKEKETLNIDKIKGLV